MWSVHGSSLADHKYDRATELDAASGYKIDDTSRRARQGPRSAQNEASQVHRVQTVGILGRIHQAESPGIVEASGQRQLNQVAGARGVRIQLADRGLERGRPGRRGQFNLNGGDTDLRTVAVLARHVRSAAGIVTNKHRPQSGGNSTLGQRRYPITKLRLDRPRQSLAVQYLCRHVSLSRL